MLVGPDGSVENSHHPRSAGTSSPSPAQSPTVTRWIQAEYSADFPRLSLITVDCWGTLLQQDQLLDPGIERAISSHIGAAFPDASDSQIARIIREESIQFGIDLGRAMRVPSPSDRLARILRGVAGLLEVSVPPGWASESACAAIDDVLLEFPPTLNAGATFFLRQARLSNIPVVMISNTGWISSGAVKRAFDGFYLVGLFKDWLFSDEGYLHKPAPDMFRLAARSAGCPPEELAHIGDNPDTDHAGAVGAGALSIVLCAGQPTPVERVAGGFRVATLSDAWQTLRGMM